MIPFRQNGNLVVLDVTDAVECENLSEVISEHMDKNAKHIIVNLSNLQVVESRTLGTLVATMKICEDRGTELVFYGIQPYLEQMLTLTKLNQLLKIYSSEEEAVSALSNS